TVTAWILSLSGIEGDNIFIQLLKPTSFTPVLALIGIVLYMFLKNGKHKDTGLILLGFATLMFGMDTMSDAVSGLRDVPAFQELFLLFKNPILGVLAGAILTAIIQSSSASVGILQALAVTGQVSYGAAIPIIMGQNIGTCVTAMLSSVGTTKNARRAAMVHLVFNIIGTVVCLIVFILVDLLLAPVLFDMAADYMGIAIAHSVFNVVCVLLLLPLSGLLEKLVCRMVPDEPGKEPEKKVELDERLLATPTVALEQCHSVAMDMAQSAAAALLSGVRALGSYNEELAQYARDHEEKTDIYEDVIGTYLVKLSTRQISEHDSAEATKLLKIIGDFERISDHGVDLVESAEELRSKKLNLSEAAVKELAVISEAIQEILSLTLRAFTDNDLEAANSVEPLEQVIDDLKETMRTRHMIRLQQGGCSIETGFVWSDMLTNLERTSDHCSNIAACIIDVAHNNMNLHQSTREVKTDSEDFRKQFAAYAQKYRI
ncbi:MAG: Na/Pi cotransporter family protein, partial [Clostridia bacterium]|nr:Na/Pi cotransporter family protein [Clostridia bacterium]